MLPEVEESLSEAFSSSSSQELVPCNHCGRRFNPDAVGRHEPICLKSTQKKRKTFDAAKQRVEGTDIKTVQKSKGRTTRSFAGKNEQHSHMLKNATKNHNVTSNITGANNPSKTAAIKAVENRKNNWRSKHQDFINTIRAAKSYDKAKEAGGPLPPPPPPTINPDYVQCDFCGRRFNETAAARHRDFCKEQKSRLPQKKAPTAAALQRAAARTEYKAPRLKAKVSPQSTGYGYGNGSGGMNGSTSNKNAGRSTMNGGSRGYQASHYEDDLGSPTGSGRALRTGRTAETYTEARELSAKQRSQMGRSTTTSKKGYNPTRHYSPASDTYESPQYGGYGGTGSPIASSGDARKIRTEPARAASAKFCHNCGTRYPVQTAKFCCECGLKRMAVS